MQEYETRILNVDRTPALLMTSMHLNADAAIKTARRVATGRPFEVWRDDECVYAAVDGPPLQFPLRRSA
jgi:hypothetical protein